MKLHGCYIVWIFVALYDIIFFNRWMTIQKIKAKAIVYV